MTIYKKLNWNNMITKNYKNQNQNKIKLQRLIVKSDKLLVLRASTYITDKE